MNIYIKKENRISPSVDPSISVSYRRDYRVY